MKNAFQPTAKVSLYLAYKTKEDVSDEELMNQIANRNIQAFERLFARYWQELYGMAFRRVLSKSEAKAIVVNVFEILWKNSNEVLGSESVRGYMQATLMSQIFLHYERRPSIVKKILRRDKFTR